MQIKYIIKEDDKNKYNTINSILINELDFSNRLLSKLIKQKLVLVNNKIFDTRNSFSVGDIITINFDFEEDNSNIVPIKMDLDIVYEDEWFLVLNKPPKIAIHPSILHFEDSLSNGVKYYFDKIKLKKKIRPVNRLDSNTSGLVIFAKCEYVQECLSKQMQKGIFKKEYLCLVLGKLNNLKGPIDLPISRKENSIIERCVNSNGQKSITHYEVLKEYKDFSLIKCKLETGRTHQIRVHFSYIGHPLLGDTLYGTKSELINRQALHSCYIEFIHPITNMLIQFSSELPKDIKSLLD